MKISVIIPVYNRPLEVHSLLESLVQQESTEFETLIVEDGSSDTCEKIVDLYREKLTIHYIAKENSGPGQSRNTGCLHAHGQYFIFLDSDCVLPPQYITVIKKALADYYADSFGGPDAAMDDFSPLQKSINYSMTSFFTTGGIRGGGERLGKFQPRSFNMGFSREVFEKTGGFSDMRFGEDIDMSLRILQHGFRVRLIKDAFVYHRRRTNLRRFFKQVFNSGIARINLQKRHPGSLKWVHAAPAAFTVGSVAILLLALYASPLYLLLLLLFVVTIFLDSTIKTRSLRVGLLAVIASFVQLFGYGTGFLYAAIKRFILKKEEFAEFQQSFYK